jgi:hypothetical protein
VDDVDRDKSQRLGLLSHLIIGTVNNGFSLKKLSEDENLSNSEGSLSSGFQMDDLSLVRGYLDRLTDHPLVKQMEKSLDSRNEFTINRPFGKYIL